MRRRNLRGYAAATFERSLASEETSGSRAISRRSPHRASFRATSFGALVDPNISPVARRSIVADLLTDKAPVEAAPADRRSSCAPPHQQPVSCRSAPTSSALVESARDGRRTSCGHMGAVRRASDFTGYAERVLEEVSAAADGR